jgi:methionyl-tRNA synthetase
LAGVYVPSDIYSRYLRLQGRERFVCLRKRRARCSYFYEESQEEGITPQEVIDTNGIIRKSFADFGISFDNYSELRLRFTMIRLKIFKKNYMIMAIL